MGGNGSKSADAAVAASPSKAKPSSPTGGAAHMSMRYGGAGGGALGSVVGGVGGMERDMSRNFKVLVVGAPRVGKTCVVHRYLRNVYVGGAGPGGHGPPPTARVEVGLKFIEAAYFYAVQVWECPAVDWQFERLRTTWFRDVTGMVIVVSTRNLESFKVIDDWKRAADEYSAELKIPPIPIIVLANRFTTPQEKDRERERLYGPPHHSSAAFQAAAHSRRSRGHLSKRSIDLADPSDLAQADDTVTEATMRETAQTFQVAAGYLGSAYTGAGIDKCFRYLLQRMVARDRDWRMVSVPMPVGPGGHAHTTGALSALLSAGGSQPNTQRASHKSVDDSARTDDSKIGAGALAPGDEKYPLPAIADGDGGADGVADGGDGTGTGTGDGTGTGGELEPVTPAPESEDGAVLEPKTPLLDTSSLAEDGGGDEATSGAIGRRSAGASAGAPFARRGTGGPKRTGSFGFDGKLPDGSAGGGGGSSPPKTPDADAAAYNARGSVLGMSIAEGDEEYSVSKNNMRDLSRAGSAHGARPISGGGAGGAGDGMADAGFDPPQTQTIVGHGPDEAPATEEELAAAAAAAAAEAAALEAAADAAAAGAAAAELMAADTQADADLAASEKELAAKEAEINAQMAELERLEAAASAAVGDAAGAAAADGAGAGPSAPASSPAHAAGGDAGAHADPQPEPVQHAEPHAEVHADAHVDAHVELAHVSAAEPAAAAAATVAAEVHAEPVAPAEPEPVAPASLAELTDAIAAAYQAQAPAAAAEPEAAAPADADAAADAALLAGDGQSQAVGVQDAAAVAPAEPDTTEATTSALTNSIAEAYAQAEAAADAAGNTVAAMASAPADAAAADGAGDAAAAPAEPAPAGDA